MLYTQLFFLTKNWVQQTRGYHQLLCSNASMSRFVASWGSSTFSWTSRLWVTSRGFYIILSKWPLETPRTKSRNQTTKMHKRQYGKKMDNDAWGELVETQTLSQNVSFQNEPPSWKWEWIMTTKWPTIHQLQHKQI